jgi:hypothetical protein
MARNFEVFTGRNKPASNKTMRVSLNKRGAISFNHAAFVGMGEPKAVELLYDKETKAIGVRASTEEARHAYPVRSQGNSKSYLIGAVAFTQYYDIKPESTIAFDPLVEDGVMVLEFSKAVNVAQRAAPKNGKSNGHNQDALPLEMASGGR